MSEKISLWEKIVKRFKNSWVGVFILTVSVLFYFLKDVRKDLQEGADRKIAMEKEELKNATNKRLKAMIDSMIVRIVRRDVHPDTLCQLVETYISIRKSFGYTPDQEVGEKEFKLKQKLFKYTHEYVEIWSNQKVGEDDEARTKVLLKQLCNKILAFCEFTSTCNTSEINTIKLTKDELEKN